MESLDASYALLSDVSARNRELQARLRNKMPFLWTDTELLRIKGPPRRHRAKKLPGEQAASIEADQMLLALEGQAVTRQYKRRVEWEVARRIARVDREMQQYQPAQRFWNQKREKTVAPRTTASAKRRLHENLSDAAGGDVVKRQDEESGGREKRKEVKVTVIECKSDVTAETKRKKKWVRPDIEKKTDERLAENRVVVRQVCDRELDKENALPNTAINRKEQLLLRSLSPSIASATINQRDDVPLVENQNKTKPDIEPASSSKTEVENNTSLPAQIKSTRWQDERNSTSEENVEKVSEEALYLQRKRDADQKSPGRIHTLKKDRASSSIGKQVLSEYRTMPSAPSFGTPPILSTGKSTQFRLNPDVLRRLFSDLDTDKDGLLNRIETCLALHRLQISVPTARIITFFRHIHSSDRKGTSSWCGKHVPTKEAINYKQFVAFVTTAYDQQQQHKKTRRHSVTRFKKWQNDRGRSPLPVPLTTLPTFASPTSSTVKTSRPSALIRKDEIPVYEMDDVGLEKNEVCEERMINEITDFVVGTILADTSGAASEENRDVTESIVRKSLESLVGEDAVNIKLVDEITCELIKERLRRISAPNQEDTDDITGLRKALAHCNEQILEGDKATSLVAEQSSSENSINAVDILEEQVGCGCIGQGPDVQSVRLVDEATDTHELLSAPVEKAIQVPETVNQKNDEEHANIKVVPPQVPESMSSQTHLVQTLRVSHTAREYTMGLDELLTLVSAIKILEQRQLHQRDALEEQTDFPISEAKNLSPIPPRIDLVNKEDMFSSDEANESVSSKTVPLDSVPVSKTKAAITCTHTFMRANSYESSAEYENSVSMSSSSSFSESSDDYYVHSMHQKVERHPFYDRSTRHRRPQRSQRSVFKSVSDNSGLDSICSAELSEGELSCEDLSDGEIFDACKRRYAKSKLANPNMMKRSRESQGLISSVESGELPGLTKVHATHESQVLGRSAFSSIESGEVEDGRIMN